ncbi:hypothetical protein BDK51DRAFT_30821 [Blyttiomyces helicus]|uniref:Uncharacterized protein n=1 Tax=Blyttiomyces helicus TaxID=388810 RepID=A0A4V1IRU1_9FUNG|nr:hypothetical protein BDK51DRAFT_30821 [Blyttiomyces helicus]|eukprot:RKO91237.1 hypothetical protein BDK51DRAFT_30821 [Blyttiomyces helicus]
MIVESGMLSMKVTRKTSSPVSTPNKVFTSLDSQPRQQECRPNSLLAFSDPKTHSGIATNWVWRTRLPIASARLEGANIGTQQYPEVCYISGVGSRREGELAGGSTLRVLGKLLQKEEVKESDLISLYHKRNYTWFSNLITAHLVGEKNNQLLLKNHWTRPTGAAPVTEANTASVATVAGGVVAASMVAEVVDQSVVKPTAIALVQTGLKGVPGAQEEARAWWTSAYGEAPMGSALGATISTSTIKTTVMEVPDFFEN